MRRCSSSVSRVTSAVTKRMPVPVSSDPRAEAYHRACRGIAKKVLGIVLFVPSPAQPVVELGHGRGKDIPQVEHQGPSLIGYLGLVEKDFTASPEALEADLDLAADLTPFARGEVGAVPLGEELLNEAVLLENRTTLGLGRMRREDRLDADRGEVRGDFLGGPAFLSKTLELITPESALGGEAVTDLLEAAGALGGVGLDNVEKLKGDGIGLLEALGSLDLFLFPDPGETVFDFFLAEFLEELVETGHEFEEILVDLGKTFGDVFFFHRET